LTCQNLLLLVHRVLSVIQGPPPPQLTQQQENWECPSCQCPPNMGILRELFVLTWGFFISYCQMGNPWKSLTASGQSYFQQPFRVTDSAHQWPPLYYHAIWFPRFTDTKKGLLLAHIHDAAECTVRVVMREYHGDYLAAWLQWWGGFLGDTQYGYFDGQDQNLADSRTMRPYNARFFDFRYHSTWWKKQLLNQSCNNCFINQASVFDFHNTCKWLVLQQSVLKAVQKRLKYILYCTIHS